MLEIVFKLQPEDGLQIAEFSADGKDGLHRDAKFAASRRFCDTDGSWYVREPESRGQDLSIQGFNLLSA